MRVGITGHQDLNDSSTWKWVKEQIDNILNQAELSVGITSLAKGADQIFADAVIRNKGLLEVIIPFKEYDLTFEDDVYRNQFYYFVQKASRIEILEKSGSDEESFFVAGKRVVNLSECIIAIWDGKPAEGLGGTGDIVDYTLKEGKSLIWINPINRKVVM